ncbi:6-PHOSPHOGLUCONATE DEHYDROGENASE [Salix purpurea]|uniref:phosphogluconate dehydrogenase (NADP(+)-dependent, decarboxylating) n=1 Tax=Salix purpurea TaxID=77065 RepID=A0A9Q0Z251_SALPP|nr:6-PHOSPHOGLUCONATE DEHYDROGENASE [Salix purpurea]
MDPDAFGIKDDEGEGYLVDNVLDKTGTKGTGKWTVQQAAELSVAAPTIASSLNGRFHSGLREQRAEAVFFFNQEALVTSCNAQGMNLVRAKNSIKGWDLKLGELARIWKGGCIIHAVFLDRVKKACVRNPDLPDFLADPGFAKETVERQSAW